MSAIKNCTVLVWNDLVDSYHTDVASARERAAFIVHQWEQHTTCGSSFPKPRLEVTTAAEYIRKQYATSF